MRHNFILYLLLLGCTLLMSGCATQALPASGDIPKTPSELQPTPISEALFQVVLPDGSAIGFTWDDLKELPLGQVTAEGKTEEGPKIQDVLQAAGVSDYQQITLTGVNGSLTLSRNQVDEGAVLDFTNHGTVKLSATSVPKDKWIKDITEISVE